MTDDPLDDWTPDDWAKLQAELDQLEQGRPRRSQGRRCATACRYCSIVGRHAVRLCDYRHIGPDSAISDIAAWVLIGEAGDYYVCDWHFQQRSHEGKRGWSRIGGAA